MRDTLQGWGLENVHVFSRGVDTTVFNTARRTSLPWPRPIMLYVGRIAPEKNLEAFLNLDLPGTKIIVGDGPARLALEGAYPDAQFVGAHRDETLARWYASADVFVFPSRTDTFGIVNIEAMGCGTPVAAYPVPGPKDIVQQGVNGWLDEDLKTAIQRCLALPRELIPDSVRDYHWADVGNAFLKRLAPIPRS